MIRRIAHHDLVFSEHPQITGSAHGRLRQVRYRVFIRQSRGGVLRREKLRQFHILETEQAHVEVFILKSLDFDAKQLVIPASVFGQLVVGDDVRALLCFAQMIENDDRDFGESQLPRGKKTTVARDEASLRIHQNRIVKAELSDAGGDLGDLGVGVGPGVSGPGDQLVDQPHLNVLRHPMQIHDWFSSFQLLTSNLTSMVSLCPRLISCFIYLSENIDATTHPLPLRARAFGRRDTGTRLGMKRVDVGHNWDVRLGHIGTPTLTVACIAIPALLSDPLCAGASYSPEGSGLPCFDLLGSIELWVYLCTASRCLRSKRRRDPRSRP